jgi:2,3-bisphosphoglycerate-independent phosphoglycerate mutase
MKTISWETLPYKAIFIINSQLIKGYADSIALEMTTVRGMANAVDDPRLMQKNFA